MLLQRQRTSWNLVQWFRSPLTFLPCTFFTFQVSTLILLLLILEDVQAWISHSTLLPMQLGAGLQEIWLPCGSCGSPSNRGSCTVHFPDQPHSCPPKCSYCLSSNRKNIKALSKPWLFLVIKSRSSCGTNIFSTFSFSRRKGIVSIFCAQKKGRKIQGTTGQFTTF